MEKIDRDPNQLTRDFFEEVGNKLNEIVDWINERSKPDSTVESFQLDPKLFNMFDCKGAHDWKEWTDNDGESLAYWRQCRKCGKIEKCHIPF